MAPREPPDGDEPRVVPLKEARARRDRAARTGAKPNGAHRPAPGNGAGLAATTAEAPTPPVAIDEVEFRPLGHDHGTFYFHSRRSGQIVPLTARALVGEGALLELAPLNFWESHFPKKGGYDKSAAVNALISACLQRGVFDVARCRGRGAWWDDGRAVLHLGDRLAVDGKHCNVANFKSKYIYEEGAAFGVDPRVALSGSEAPKFLELCEHLTWERPYMAQLLAGWCVVAPICGALRWRPHLWIIGESGGGKSILEGQIINPALAGIAARFQLKTTEAGIRQHLKSDALPVLFDEIENDTPSDRARIQGVIDLARAASTEGGAPIAKGGQTGTGQHYHVRSAFCFLSVLPTLSHQQDENRFSVLRLLGQTDNSPDGKANRAEHYALLQRMIAETITREFPAKLLARSIAMMPTIRHNAEALAIAAAQIMPTRRNADQLGAILAGTASLKSSKRFTPDDATKFILALGWIDEAAIEASADPDHMKLLAYLCQQILAVRLPHGQNYEKSIGDLIAFACGISQEDFSQEAAAELLRRTGIKIERLSSGQHIVWFANNHHRLKLLLSNTPWSDAWHISLARCSNAIKSPHGIRFGHGTLARAVGIPRTMIVDDPE